MAVFNFSKGGGFYSLSKSPEGAEQRAGRGQLFQYGGLYLHRCPAAGLVCSNGMVVNDAQTRRTHIGRVNEADENFQLFSQETLAADDHAFAMKIKDTVMAAADETRFTRVVGMMREATTVQMNTTDIPSVVRLASKDFNITEEESTGVLQRLIEGKDLTLYGLSNAVTRFSQDVDSYDRATALEGIGYNILSMPRQQWNRINQMAA